MVDASNVWLTAEEIVRDVGAGSLDAQSVVTAHLDAIERLDPRIHAYVYVDRGARGGARPPGGGTQAV
jgi:Asp-tRNA(Asn)/Glu-tRNA(Gln) amidotransferase A subunit family amidase